MNNVINQLTYVNELYVEDPKLSPSTNLSKSLKSTPDLFHPFLFNGLELPNYAGNAKYFSNITKTNLIYWKDKAARDSKITELINNLCALNLAHIGTFMESKSAIPDNLSKIYSEIYELADIVLVLGKVATTQLCSVILALVNSNGLIGRLTFRILLYISISADSLLKSKSYMKTVLGKLMDNLETIKGKILTVKETDDYIYLLKKYYDGDYVNDLDKYKCSYNQIIHSLNKIINPEVEKIININNFNTITIEI